MTRANQKNIDGGFLRFLFQKVKVFLHIDRYYTMKHNMLAAKKKVGLRQNNFFAQRTNQISMISFFLFEKFNWLEHRVWIMVLPTLTGISVVADIARGDPITYLTDGEGSVKSDWPTSILDSSSCTAGYLLSYTAPLWFGITAVNRLTSIARRKTRIFHFIPCSQQIEFIAGSVFRSFFFFFILKLLMIFNIHMHL